MQNLVFFKHNTSIYQIYEDYTYQLIINLIHTLFHKNHATKNERSPLSVYQINMRTTSSLEAMNSQINRSFGLKQPNIFKFMGCLKMHEYRKGTDMLHLASELIIIANISIAEI